MSAKKATAKPAPKSKPAAKGMKPGGKKGC
jgi:hypothetical protein